MHKVKPGYLNIWKELGISHKEYDDVEDAPRFMEDMDDVDPKEDIWTVSDSDGRTDVASDWIEEHNDNPIQVGIYRDTEAVRQALGDFGSALKKVAAQREKIGKDYKKAKRKFRIFLQEELEEEKLVNPKIYQKIEECKKAGTNYKKNEKKRLKRESNELLSSQ
jgi:hypothetical protein